MLCIAYVLYLCDAVDPGMHRNTPRIVGNLDVAPSCVALNSSYSVFGTGKFHRYMCVLRFLFCHHEIVPCVL